jgi:hypothetical protein
MRAFLSAVVALIVISVGSEYALRELGWTSAERAAATSTVRLPGHQEPE